MRTNDDVTECAFEALLDEYRVTLPPQTKAAREGTLGQTYDLGRLALARRQSLLDIVSVHHAALDRALGCEECGAERKRTLKAAAELLAELLSPFDLAQGAFLEANAALRSANDLLEHEAHRIARLLHDSAGQIVFALQLALARLDGELPKRYRGRTKELSELLQQLDQQLHCHAQELFPVVLVDLGLPAAVRELIDNLRRRQALSMTFLCTVSGRLPRDVESCVYRAIQEALTNVLKHARATDVTVMMGVVGTMLVCSIADNGVGFTPRAAGGQRQGLGLVSLRERMQSINGTVQVRSREGQGTEVILGVPLPPGKGTHGAERLTR